MRFPDRGNNAGRMFEPPELPRDHPCFAMVKEIIELSDAKEVIWMSFVMSCAL